MATPDIPLKEALQSVPADKRLMGLDLGSKTIGVATSDRTRMIATPIETIERKKFTQDAERLIEIATRENIGLIVLGLPVNMDGSEGPRCQSTRAFARNFATALIHSDRLLGRAPVDRRRGAHADPGRCLARQARSGHRQARRRMDPAGRTGFAPMTTIFLALLPVFIVILIGFALRRFNIIRDEQWLALDQLCYFVLFPAIIFKEIAAADFSSVPVLEMALAMIMAVLAMFALLLIFHKPIMAALRIDGPQFTSVVQGAARWHTFIAFAIIPLQFGPQALSLGAVSAAAMTPLLNILAVIVMSRFARESKLDAKTMALSIIRNPFVFSSLGGVAWQLSGLTMPEMGIQVLDMIGRGALGLALLTVGAGLRLGEAMSAWPPVAAATILKLLVMPAFHGCGPDADGRHGRCLRRGVALRRRANRIRRLCAGPPDGGRRPHGREHPHASGNLPPPSQFRSFSTRQASQDKIRTGDACRIDALQTIFISAATCHRC
jgi:malonate transporter and related proteins